MKKTTLTLLLVCLCAAPAFAQGWKALTLPVDDAVTGLSFINPDTGFMVTNRGTLILTYDGARTWQTRRINAGAQLEGVSFANSKLGLACAKHGDVFRTTDGGTTWTKVTPKMDSVTSLFSVQLFDKLNGLVIGMSRADSTPYAGRAWRTADGGQTWTPMEQMGMGYSEIFYSPKLGAYFPSFGQFHYSSDKGKTWQTIKATHETRARDIAFLDHTGLMTGPKGFCIVSHDDGKTWTEHKQDPNLTFVAAALATEKDMYMGGLHSVMMHSTDGGENWERELLSRSFDVLDMAVVGDRLYAVGSDGGIVYKQLK